MNVGIKIMPRDVILDSQGRAIESSMKSNGFQLDSLRAGKYLEIRHSDIDYLYWHFGHHELFYGELKPEDEPF